MARRQKRRPVFGGAVLGAAIALLLLVLNVGPTTLMFPWGVLGAAIGGGALGNTVRNSAGDASIQALFEHLFAGIGQFIAPLFELIGGLLDGFST
ncbi:MAG: hypothetical protein VX501_04685 [Pseudomonadota bacterium]|nr:hypothetical protein [Pseudomonadota bacterium]